MEPRGGTNSRDGDKGLYGVTDEESEANMPSEASVMHGSAGQNMDVLVLVLHVLYCWVLPCYAPMSYTTGCCHAVPCTLY